MIEPASNALASACFSEQLVIDLTAGELAGPELAAAERHLATCDDCTELVARVAAHSPRQASVATQVARGPELAESARPGRPGRPLPSSPQDLDSPPAAQRGPREGPSPSLRAGTILRDTYRIIRHLEKGGMGEVYEASHARLSGRYAVKVLPSEFAANKTMLARFRREAQIASALQHPNIVQVIDFHETDEGRPYLVMEYLDGENLARLLARNGPLKLTEALSIVQQVGAALGAVHRQGVVHRDIKPQNIFIIPQEDGTRLVKLLDFGISKGNVVSSVVTRQPALMGTPQYMAPEQALRRMEEIGPATDQFALAAITYEMLMGRAAFDGPLMPVVLYHIVHEPPPPMGATPGFERVEPVLLRALSKEPGGRFPSMADFTAAFTAAVGPVRSSQPQRAATPSVAIIAAPTSGGAAAGVDVTAVANARQAPRRGAAIPLLLLLLAATAVTTALFLVKSLGTGREHATANPAGAAAGVSPTPASPSPPVPSVPPVLVTSGAASPGAVLPMDSRTPSPPSTATESPSAKVSVPHARIPGAMPRAVVGAGMMRVGERAVRGTVAPAGVASKPPPPGATALSPASGPAPSPVAPAAPAAAAPEPSPAPATRLIEEL